MGGGSDAAPRRSRHHDAVSTSTVLVILGTFLASAVEMVEALTIVLGVGIVRGWRSTLIGVGAALIVLAALVAALGPALSVVPIETLRLIVGALLLAFGLQWLRKAILRSSGYTPLHDEDGQHDRRRADAEEGRPPAAGDPDREHDRQRLDHLDGAREERGQDEEDGGHAYKASISSA